MLIYLQQPNVLFLKPRKVAGTSLEIALSKFATKKAIITRIAQEDEALRRRLGYRGRQNDYKRLRDYKPTEFARFIFHGKRPIEFKQHMSAAEARKKLGSKVFDGALKVTVVRNHWDALVSYYYWDLKMTNNQEIHFCEWAKRNPHLLNINEEQYLIHGKNVIDHYIRYEYFMADTIDLERQIPELEGLYQLFSGIKAKSDSRPKDRSVFEHYRGCCDLISAIRFFNRFSVETFEYDISIQGFALKQ